MTPEEYDEATARWPEMCPLYYMGDRRTGRQLLDGLDADAAEPLEAPAPADLAAAAADGAAGGGRRAWLLERMAGVVTRLAGFLAAAEPATVTADDWERAVRRCTGGDRCGRGPRPPGR